MHQGMTCHRNPCTLCVGVLGVGRKGTQQMCGGWQQALERGQGTSPSWSQTAANPAMGRSPRPHTGYESTREAPGC